MMTQWKVYIFYKTFSSLKFEKKKSLQYSSSFLINTWNGSSMDFYAIILRGKQTELSFD